MRKTVHILAALLVFIVSGCGLTSGTAFVSTSIDERIETEVGGTLDDQFGGAVVDFTDESGWQDFTIEGVEDGCIALDAWNLLAQPVSGEIWITTDTTTAARNAINSVADVQAAGGFRIFSGIALAAGPNNPANPAEAQHFTCAETISLLENVDQLVAAMQTGYFVVWGAGDQDEYHLVFDGLAFGIHVTGSL